MVAKVWECFDCKYFIMGKDLMRKCTHPSKDKCSHCELWTPKYYTENTNKYIF